MLQVLCDLFKWRNDGGKYHFSALAKTLVLREILETRLTDLYTFMSLKKKNSELEPFSESRKTFKKNYKWCIFPRFEFKSSVCFLLLLLLLLTL